MAVGFNTYNEYEVTQETECAVLNTAKVFKLFVRQLISVEFRVPSDDEPIDTVREPRQVMTLPMVPPMLYDPVPSAIDETESVRVHKLLEEFNWSREPSHVLVFPPWRTRGCGTLRRHRELTG